MARIELRHATIRLVDGYANTAAVDETLIATDTDMDIDTLGTSEIIPLSTRFTAVGDGEQHTVTAQNASPELTYDIQGVDGGNYTITVDAVTSANILWSSDIATIIAAVEAMANVTAGDFDLTGAGTTVDPFILIASDDGAFNDTATAMSAADVDLTTGSLTQVQTHAGAATHNITFTPALATSNVPADDAVITFTGRTLEVKVGEGNMTYTESKEFNYDLDKGDLDTVREGDQQPMDWTLDLTWEFLTSIAGAVTPTIEEAFKRTGPASTWESSSADPCEPYSIDIEVEHVPNCSTDEIETTTIPDTRYESLEHDIDGATVSASGRSNATQAIHARTAQVA